MRQKRRSKYDNAGRDFKCQFWDNAYLSYPAMYTHMKTKHYYTGSEGDMLAGGEGQGIPGGVIMNTGRGRGRPKKNYGRVTKLNPESDDYFKTMDKAGGPTDPLLGFEDSLVFVKKAMGEENPDFAKCKLYEHLKKFGYEETPGNEENDDVEKVALRKDPALEKQYLKMSEEERNSLSWDDIFAVYLRETSQKVNENFYKLLLRYMIWYRECANRFGWSKLDKEGQAKGGNEDTNETEDEKEHPIDFWEVNNAEHIPDLWNEFITVFLEEYSFGIERADAIDMTRNFCNWLYVQGHTCSKLSMAS